VISQKDSIDVAINIMGKNEIGALPVGDSDKKMVGIVSESDFVNLLSGVLTDEVVEDYMTKKVISTTPGPRIEGASKIMVRNKLRRIPVVGEDRKTSHPEKDKIMGIVTATDILEFLGKNSAFDKMVSNNAEDVLNTTITEIMEEKVFTTTANTRLGDLCTTMEQENIGGLPVIYNGELEGIITERDILKAVSKLKEYLNRSQLIKNPLSRWLNDGDQ
jgi:CBS domain-containing protein